jgi:hypothetical protein
LINLLPKTFWIIIEEVVYWTAKIQSILRAGFGQESIYPTDKYIFTGEYFNKYI